MAQTVTADKTVSDQVRDLLHELQDEVRILTDMLPADEAKRAAAIRVLSAAWLAGFIEMGRLKYCSIGVPFDHSGTVNSKARGQCLLLESGWDWTGDKRVHHKRLAEIVAEDKELQDYLEYAKYVQDDNPKAEVGSMMRVKIKREEAHRAIALRVRLTDKGLAQLRA